MATALLARKMRSRRLDGIGGLARSARQRPRTCLQARVGPPFSGVLGPWTEPPLHPWVDTGRRSRRRRLEAAPGVLRPDLEHGCIAAPEGEQLLVAAVLDHPTLVDEHHPVGSHGGGEAV